MKKKNNENLVFLKGVENDVEACVIKGLLDSCEIKSTLKYDSDIGGAEVIIGKSMVPASVYVHKEDFDKANEILNSQFYNEDE